MYSVANAATLTSYTMLTAVQCCVLSGLELPRLEDLVYVTVRPIFQQT